MKTIRGARDGPPLALSRANAPVLPILSQLGKRSTQGPEDTLLLCGAEETEGTGQSPGTGGRGNCTGISGMQSLGLSLPPGFGLFLKPEIS